MAKTIADRQKASRARLEEVNGQDYVEQQSKKIVQKNLLLIIIIIPIIIKIAVIVVRVVNILLGQQVRHTTLYACQSM